jgi:hypothetical protein
MLDVAVVNTWKAYQSAKIVDNVIIRCAQEYSIRISEQKK